MTVDMHFYSLLRRTPYLRGVVRMGGLLRSIQQPSYDETIVQDGVDFRNGVESGLSEIGGRGLPRPWDAVRELGVVKYEPGGDFLEDSCTICFEEFEMEEEVTRLPCNHIFHGGCLARWFERRKCCPLCRHGPSTSAAVL